ncbi:hypothetical protein F5Y14DRAFT_445865 [Nemania sp. NC0429]|nr:hypothetical protein F5Y14DRAFT_445865 [Nemania sp. NC0429]
MAYDFTVLDLNDETFAHEFGHRSPFELGPYSYPLTTDMFPSLPVEFPWEFQQTLEADIASGVGTTALGRGSAKTDLVDYTASAPLCGPEHPPNHNQESPSATRQFRCHSPDRARFPCPLCNKSFNRRDNLQDHLYKHTQERSKKARIKFYPEAKAVYEREMQKCSKRRKVQEKPEPHNTGQQ